MRRALLALTLVCGLAPAAMAQTVGLSGMLGGKALLIVDGGAPKTVAVGDTFKGVKVLSTQGDQAVIEINGKQHTLRVGDAPASVGGGGGTGASGNRVVLTAGNGGHFFTLGQINGKSTQMVVDTGATGVHQHERGPAPGHRLQVRQMISDEHGQRGHPRLADQARFGARG
jgi:aspartyl protease family protein